MPDKDTLLTWAAAIRQQKEAAGIDFQGMRIETDERSRSVLTAAYLRATQDANYTIPNWKIADGVYVTLGAGMIVAAGNAVSDYIQRCFDKNREVDEAIATGAIISHGQIIEAFEG